MSNYCISWNPQEAYYNTMYIILLIPTFCSHIVFWIQVCIHKSLRHGSLLWIYNYLILDMASLGQLFLEYITRHSKICGISPTGYNILCILEAYSNSYITMVQSFALVLTNIYRYRLIVKKKKISIKSIGYLIVVHLFIYSLPLSIFITQHFLSATVIVDVYGLSCDIEFSTFANEFLHLFFLAILPIGINIPVLFIIIRHVQNSQNTVRSVRRIHRQLIIQFIVLYTIWLLFLIPQVIFLLSIESSTSQRMVSKILDMAGILSDVLVVTLFDCRFIKAWKKSIQGILVSIQRNNRRISPIITRPTQTVRVQQMSLD